MLFGFAAAVATAVVVVYVLIVPPPEDNASTNSPSNLGIGGEQTKPALPPIADDPRADGWDTEAFSESAAKQLKALAQQLTHEEDIDKGTAWKASIADHLADDFHTTALRPESLETVFSDGPLVVRRWDSAGAETEFAERMGEGAEGLISAWTPLREFLAESPAPDFQIKIERVDARVNDVAARVLFSAQADTNDRSRQVQAVWQCTWLRNNSSAKPRLAAIELTRYEEVEAGDAAHWRFADCTSAALGGSEAYRAQFLIGTEAWLERTVKGFDRTLWGDQGMAVGDADGDGRDDIYFCDMGLLPNRLFVQQPDGTFREQAAARGVDFLDHCRGALFIDLDNDGDQDLAIAASAALLLLENDGRGNFSQHGARTDVVDAHSLAAADYDGDGRLDLYACLYHKERYGQDEYPFPVPYHDARNGGRNVLLRSAGDWKFTDVTAATGLDEHNDRWSLAAAWEDYDNDGDPDLYVANDFGRNCLYRNDGGKFRELAAAAGVEDVGSGMSVAWGDYDRDGFVDLYVSNMYSTAGGRIAYQGQFQPHASPEMKAVFQRMGKGNTLFRNKGDGTFEDTSQQAAVARARWAWGARFVDVNNDAWDDLIVANGFVTRDDERDL